MAGLRTGWQNLMSADPRAAARQFVRSLNILLKYSRLYEFGHVRTAAQFETTWKELRSALDSSGESGLLLGASGQQILLDGVPLGAAAAERSFAIAFWLRDRQHSLRGRSFPSTIRAIRARLSY